MTLMISAALFCYVIAVIGYLRIVSQLGDIAGEIATMRLVLDNKGRSSDTIATGLNSRVVDLQSRKFGPSMTITRVPNDEK